MSLFIGPRTLNNSFFSFSPTLSLSSAFTRSSTSALKSAVLTPMPACASFMDLPAYVQGPPPAWQIWSTRFPLNVAIRFGSEAVNAKNLLILASAATFATNSWHNGSDGLLTAEPLVERFLAPHFCLALRLHLAGKRRLRRTCHECCAEHCCETHPSPCVHGYILLLGIQRVARNPDRRSTQSGGLSLLTLAANVRPRHRCEARLRNGLLQTTHTPYVPCLIRSSASSIARKSRPSV